jgi:uncharacterized protein YciI
MLLLLLLGGASPSPAPAARTVERAPAATGESVRYTLGLLVRGPAWTPERSAHADSIQAGHMANIGRMAGLGALVAAGPFVGNGELRGVFVFAPGAAGLDTLMAEDPAIASGRLACRLYPWIAPVGIGEEYRRRASAHGSTGQGMPDSMVTFGWVLLRRGPHYDSRATPAVVKLLTRHREHLAQLRAKGRLIYAGDIEGTGELRGVLVMQGDSAQVMRAVLDDPAVRSQRFTPQVLRWWTAWGTIPGY